MNITLLGNIGLVFGGMVLSIAEFIVLYKLDKLVYFNHLMGYILITLGVVIWASICFDMGETLSNLPMLFKVLYYTYNPIAEIILALCMLFVKDLETYYLGLISLPFVTLFFGLLIPITVTKISEQIRRFKDEA